MTDEFNDGITFAELQHKEFPPDLEAEYRRGYADGWVELVNLLSDLEDEPRFAVVKAIAVAAFEHWEGPLRAWSRAGGGRVLAPTLTVAAITDSP